MKIQLYKRIKYGRFFIFVYLLNIISNLSSLKFYNDSLSIIGIVALSALIAGVETIVSSLISPNKIRKIYQSIVISFHTILAVTEYFLLTNFRKIISQDVIDILAETNPEESSEFLETYLSPLSILLYVVTICVILSVFYVTSKTLANKRICSFVFSALIAGGVIVSGDCVYGFVKFRDGKNIPQLTSITRFGYSLYILNKNIQQIDRVCNSCKNIEITQNVRKKPTIVVIIGESHSLQHSSLYGYKKRTNPLLEKLKEEGSLLAYDNATCVETFTTASLKADYSLDSLGVDYENIALFPACFKNAGYHTELYDNQYFVGQGVNFISNKDLSECMFDVRNTKRYKYDAEMVADIKVSKEPSLYVIHLWGQHYTYKDRYPSNFNRFDSSQYDNKYTEYQRQQMADYDNACLYNDNVINSIIQKFKDQYCCIFYFSDHGEEIYELRDYMGHGDGGTSPDIRYQTNVPLLVWVSEKYKEDYIQMFKRAIHYPISMDDIGHTILDAAGLRCKDFRENRSIINPNYNTQRQRIVMHSIDYDKTVKKQKHIQFN